MGDQEYYHMPVEHPTILSADFSMDPQEDGRRSRTHRTSGEDHDGETADKRNHQD
jgi:hypothetical protein